MNHNKRDTFAALFDKAQDQHRPIADPITGVVFPNQPDLELFVDKSGELTPFGKHLTETGEGGFEVTPTGMRFTLEDRRKPRAYWVDRARVFEAGRNNRPEPPCAELFPSDDEVEEFEMHTDETSVILDLPQPVGREILTEIARRKALQ